jgi:hypothetical protein
MYRGACVNYSVEIQPAKSGLIKNDVTGKQELNILSHTQRPLNRHTTVTQPIYLAKFAIKTLPISPYYDKLTLNFPLIK